MTPTEFEQRVARIEDILGDNVTSVTWDAHVPDPDNPEQSRQVDVLVVREGLRTLVECRHRKSPQDVTWIEELYGRRASLHADAIVAVSSSGFTEGALRKAIAFGIITRDFRELTVEEVRDWGKGTRCWVEAIQFGRLQVHTVVASSLVDSLAPPQTLLERATDGGTWPLDQLVGTLAEKVDQSQRDQGDVLLQVFPRNLCVAGRPVGELFLEAQFRRLKIALLLPAIRLYGHQPLHADAGAIVVESAEPTDLSVVHAEDGMRLVLDFSMVYLPERAYLRHITFDFGQAQRMKSVEIVGEVKQDWSVMGCTIVPVVKESARHRSLVSLATSERVVVPR